MRVLAISALVAGLAVVPYAFSAEKAKATRHLTADQATNCIKQASAARAGAITKLEVSVDDGRTIFEAHVDVAANKVRLKD
jgi:hypothetical protein